MLLAGGAIGLTIAWLVLGSHLLQWTPAGYAARTPRPAGEAQLITPPSLVAVLRAGWDPLVPLLHPSASQPRT